MNRQQRRAFDRHVESKMNEARGIQADLKRPIEKKVFNMKFKRLKQLMSDLEGMGVIRKKTKFEKFKEGFTTKLLNWRNLF